MDFYINDARAHFRNGGKLTKLGYYGDVVKRLPKGFRKRSGESGYRKFLHLKDCIPNGTNKKCKWDRCRTAYDPRITELNVGTSRAPRCNAATWCGAESGAGEAEREPGENGNETRLGTRL